MLPFPFCLQRTAIPMPVSPFLCPTAVIPPNGKGKIPESAPKISSLRPQETRKGGEMPLFIYLLAYVQNRVTLFRRARWERIGKMGGNEIYSFFFVFLFNF